MPWIAAWYAQLVGSEIGRACIAWTDSAERTFSSPTRPPARCRRANRATSDAEAQIPQDADFHEFVALAERSKQLVLANLGSCDELCQAIDAYRTWQFQCAQAERLSHERQQQIVEDLARQNRDMEEKIRELLRRRLENTPK